MKQILPAGDDLVGIIHYLQIRHKNNQNEYIKINQSSRQDDSSNWGSTDVLINYNLSKVEGQSNWCSQQIKNSNFTIFFPKNSVMITNYTFLTRNTDVQNFPSNWKVEGSNGGEWTYIDHKINYLNLKGLSLMKTFSVQRPGKYKYFRFVQNGTNSNGRDYFSLGKVDIFGKLYDVNEAKECTIKYKREKSNLSTLIQILLLTYSC